MANVEFQISIDGENYNPRTLTSCIRDINGETQETKNTAFKEGIDNLNLETINIKRDYQYKESGSLLTKEKNIVNAINELFKREKSSMIKHSFTSIAHRGFSSCVPENTLSAYRKAKEVGYKFVETDVQITSDGKYVLHHDSDLSRMTNGTGTVKSKTLLEIKELNIDSGNGIEMYPNLKIPTLEEFLLLCKELNLYPVLELTPLYNWTDIEVSNFLDILKKYQMLDKCIIISFNKTSLENVRLYNYDVPLHYLADINSSNIQICKNLKNCSISSSYTTITSELVQLARENNIEVGAYTVNTFNDYNKLKKWGVTYITSDML